MMSSKSNENTISNVEAESLLHKNEETASVPEAKTSLPWRVKLSYVSLSGTLEMMATFWALFALHFMTNEANLSPTYAGIIAMLYRVWDALNDPFIGSWADGTPHYAIGRRNIWMLSGVCFYALSFTAMWFIPSNNQAVLFMWFLAVKLISDFGYTCVNVPGLALLNDLTSSYEERFQINTFRTLLVALGSLVSIGCISMFQHFYKDNREAFPRVAFLFSSILLVVVCNCCYQTRKYQNDPSNSPKTRQTSIFRRFRMLFTVKTAVYAIFTYVFSVSAVQFTLAMVPYLLKDYYQLNDMALISLVLTAQLTGIVTAVILLIVAKKVEKRYLFAFGVAIWSTFYFAVPWIPKDQTWLLYCFVVILGIGMACALLIPISFVSDSAEWVEYELGMKLEGALFGSLHLFNKFFVGLFIFFFEQVLYATNFDGSKTDQPQSAENSIRFFFMLGPMFLLFLSLVCDYFLPINKKTVFEITNANKQRRLEENGDIEILDRQGPYMTYFLIDGLDSEVFKTLLKEGKLPNIQKLIKEGVYVENGLTAFPSITGYAFYPYITGNDASRSGIMGLRWFSRKTSGCSGERNYVGRTNVHLNKDLAPSPPTIFELCSHDHSYSVQCYANRGVKVAKTFGWPLVSAKFKDYFPVSVVRYILGRYTWDQYEELVVDKAIEDMVNNPKVQWLTLASTDSLQHMYGTTQEYSNVVCTIDRLIGKYIDAAKVKGTHKQRIYAVVSDHGVVDVDKHTDLAITLQDKFGFRIANFNTTYTKTSRLPSSLVPYADKNLACAMQGNTNAMLYFRPPNKQWNQPPTFHELTHFDTGTGATINVIEEVTKIEGVELVIVKGEVANTAEIYSSVGVGVIASSDGGQSFTYAVKDGSDPLGYDSSLFGIPMSSSEWLQVSHMLEFPFVPPRVWNLVFSTSASPGDLIVTSLPGYDFGKDCEPFVKNYSGGHGGLRKDQMLVPLILKGKGIRSGLKVSTATSEDFGATVLKAMNLEISDSLSGNVQTEWLAKEKEEE